MENIANLGKVIKQEYSIALSKYQQHSTEKNNQDQQKPWNWKYAIQELISPYSWFEYKEWSYFYNTIPELEQYLSDLVTKVFSGTENGYRSFTCGDDNPVIDFLLNGGKDGRTIKDALMKIGNPELRKKTIKDIANCIIDSDIMRQFDKIILDKAINGEIEDISEKQLELKYKKEYDNIKNEHNGKEESNKMREYDDLDDDEKFHIKSIVSAQDNKHIKVSAEEVFKLRQTVIDRIFKEEQGLPFFQNMIKERQIVIDQAESLFYRPETNMAQILREAQFRAYALGDAVVISNYDPISNTMNSFLAPNDIVQWNCDKSGRITDIFIRYRMTVAQARDFFNENEFNKIIDAFSIEYNKNEESQNLIQQVFLIQKIKVSFEKQKPHKTVWITDIENKDGDYEVIRESWFNELPVHILRMGVDYATGRGKSLILNILRQIRNLYAIEKRKSVGLITALDPSIAIAQSIENTIGSVELLKPGKKILLPDEIMLRGQALTQRLDPQESEKIIQIAREEEQFIIKRIGLYLNNDALDQFTSEDLHASIGSQTVILAEQRSIQRVSRFYDIFEPFFVQMANFFVKSVASRYDNPAIPIQDNLSSWITVRIIGISEKATKDLEVQEHFQIYNQVMQTAAQMANFNPKRANKMLKYIDDKELIRGLFYKNPKLQVDNQTIEEEEQQEAEQEQAQQQMEMMQAQSQNAVAGAQINKMNADANLSAVKSQQIQNNPNA